MVDRSLACPGNLYQPTPGSSQCVDCGDGYVVLRGNGSTAEMVPQCYPSCPPGKYPVVVGGDFENQCRECPPVRFSLVIYFFVLPADACLLSCFV